MANDSFLTDDFLDMGSDNDNSIMSSDDDESRVLFGLDKATAPAAKQSKPTVDEDFIDDDEGEDEIDDIVPVNDEEEPSKPQQKRRSFKNRMSHHQLHRSNTSRRPQPDPGDAGDIIYDEDDDDSKVEPIVSVDDYKDDDEVVPVEESEIDRSPSSTGSVSSGVDFELIRKIISAFTYCTGFTEDQLSMTYSFMAAMSAMKKMTFNANDKSDDEIKIAAIIKTAIDLDDGVRTSVHNLIEAKNMDDSDRAFFLVGLDDRKKLDDIHIIMRTFSLVKNTDLPQNESFNSLAKMVDGNIKRKFITNNKAVEMVNTIDGLLQKTKDIAGDSDDSKAD